MDIQSPDIQANRIQIRSNADTDADVLKKNLDIRIQRKHVHSVTVVLWRIIILQDSEGDQTYWY